MPAKAYGKAKVGGGFAEIEDGLYPARITGIKDAQGKWDGVDYDQYIVDWTLSDMVDTNGHEVTIAQFVRIPDGLFQDPPMLNENSRLYELMDGIGCDMEDPEIEPNQWLNKEARILIENKKVESGKNAGQMRSRVTSVKKKAKGATTAAKVPGAAATKKKPDDDEDF